MTDPDGDGFFTLLIPTNLVENSKWGNQKLGMSVLSIQEVNYVIISMYEDTGATLCLWE